MKFFEPQEIRATGELKSKTPVPLELKAVGARGCEHCGQPTEEPYEVVLFDVGDEAELHWTLGLN